MKFTHAQTQRLVKQLLLRKRLELSKVEGRLSRLAQFFQMERSFYYLRKTLDVYTQERQKIQSTTEGKYLARRWMAQRTGLYH